MEEVTLLNQMLLFAHVLSLTEEDRLVWNADPSGLNRLMLKNQMDDGRRALRSSHRFSAPVECELLRHVALWGREKSTM
ncbi:hypothetical protein ACSBR1_012687 [Camellia fascicularis]